MHVLVIEDDSEIRECLSEVLREQHQVDTAGNGREALDLITGGATYDVLLLDLIMPVMGGEEFMKEMVRLGIDVPTLVLTGYTRVRIPGATVITKPFEIQGLLDAIGHCRGSVTDQHGNPHLAGGHPQEEVQSR